jgi:hypothetical protein
MKLTRLLALGILLVVVGAATIPASADTDSSPFMLFKDLRVGMEGIGKTTIGGDQIRIFQTRIVGLVDNPGELDDYILVRSSGDLIREAGGYAQGMSGSPIYFNNKLVGAFFGSYLFSDSPNPIGLVRPIETMLKIEDRIEKAVDASKNNQMSLRTDDFDHEPSAETLKNVRWDDGSTKTIEFVATPPSLATRQTHPNTAYVVRTGTPLWVSGLSGRSLDWLSSGVNATTLQQISSNLLPISSVGNQNFLDQLSKGFVQRYGTAVYPLAAAATGESGPASFSEDFEAGRPMAALLAQGDVLLGSVCTTTYIDPVKNILLACGHELFRTGDSSLFLAKARVIDTVANSQISFVLPEVDRTDIAGTVLQDRTQAIGASMDYQAQPIRLTVHIHDMTTDTDHQITVNIARTDGLTATLVFTAILQSVDDTLNRIGKGTMKVEYTIRGKGMSKKISRSDVFASFNDIALTGPLQAAQIVYLIDQNEFVDPQIDWVDVDISATNDIRWYDIKSIETDQETYHPGDTVRYIIVMKSYRGDEKKITGSFTIPADTTARRLTLYSFGGPARAQQNNQSQQVEFKSLDEMLGAIEKITGNDQLTVQVLGLPPNPKDSSADQDPTLDVQHLNDWVVTGEDRVNIQVEPQPKPEVPSKDENSDKDKDKQQSDQSSNTGSSGSSTGSDQNQSGDSGSKAPCAQLFYCQ